MKQLEEDLWNILNEKLEGIDPRGTLKGLREGEGLTAHQNIYKWYSAVTGVALDGYALPQMDQVVKCACEWHAPVATQVFRAPLRLIAWDVALVASGDVKVIEVNEVGARFFQLATGGWRADATVDEIVRAAAAEAPAVDRWLQRWL